MTLDEIVAAIKAMLDAKQAEVDAAKAKIAKALVDLA
jgi:hypothetical protein